MDSSTVTQFRDLLRLHMLSAGDLRRQVRAGQVQQVRRGAYAFRLDEERRLRHLQLVFATWPQLESKVILSHTSAAAFHGLPLFDDLLPRVCVTRPEGGHGRSAGLLRVYQCPVGQDEALAAQGARWTTFCRTTVDLARSLPFPRGVAVVDAALRLGADRTELSQLVSRYPLRKGKGRALRAIDFGDCRSESVGESESRVAMFQQGLPMPELQREVWHNGVFLGRSDFAWDEQHLLGEFDGRVKYGQLLKPRQTLTDVLLAEKNREQRLRDAGWWVVRWDYDAIHHPERLGHLIRKGFQQAAAFRGQV